MKKAVCSLLLLVVLGVVAGLVGAGFATAQAKKDKDKPTDVKAGTVIELYKDTGGKFRFRLKHDGEILAIAGKGYATKADCQKVIEAIRREAAKARLDDQAK
jgi:uncharacterized protein YegP (UPF0339 family)